MRLLGIDYGRSKVGISVGEGFLAEPYGVVKYKEEKELLKRLGDVAKKEDVVKVVVGISESNMARESERFAKRLEKSLSLPVELQDETLTSLDAQKLSMAVGIARKKRKGLEDAYAATIMLQNYIDSK